jgi:hypothetical protein
MSNESSEFFFGSGGTGAPYFPFREVGTTITGTVTTEPVVRDATDPFTGDVVTWKDGNPKKVLVVTVQTDLRDPANPEDSGQRSVWISTYGQRLAVKDALTRANASAIEVGGKLTLTFTGYGERTNPALNPPKAFSADYQKPNASAGFFNGGNGTQQAMPSDLSPEARAALANLAAKS